MATETFEIREANDLAGGPGVLVIDEEKAIVFGVKILGPVSKNGYLFPREARQKSHAILEGKFCNWNHVSKKDPEAKLQDRFGWFTGVREDVAGDCSRADLHYFREHQHAKHFIDMARNNPSACGVSLLGSCKGTVDKQGKKHVAEITRVESLDLVADPANTFGLRESEEKPAAEAKPASSGTDYTAEGCIKAIGEIIAAGGDAREMLKAITAHVDQVKEMDGEGGEDKEEKVEESTKLKARQDCFALCESLQLKAPDETFVSMLIHVPAAEREATIKKYRKTRLAKTPRSGATNTDMPVRESATPTPEPDFEKEMDRLANLVLN